jgi:hypothetical protein
VSSSMERPSQTGVTSGRTTPATDVSQTQPRPDDGSASPDISVDDSPPAGSHGSGASDGFLSSSPRRAGLESVFVRVIATAGVIAVGTALGAVLVANDVAGWIVGLAVSTVCVLCAAILWRSRQM